MENLIRDLKGPIAVLGAGGFIGGRLYRRIKALRDDIEPVTRDLGFILDPSDFKTVFNLASDTSGDLSEMLRSNVELVDRWLKDLPEDGTFIHAGSSAEIEPNSMYAITKRAASDIVEHRGQFSGKRCCTLRLYSVYGEGEQENHLLPTLRRFGREGKLPSLGDPLARYDFVHVEDVCRAFVMAATCLDGTNYGHYFDIATGESFSLGNVVQGTMLRFKTTSPQYWGMHTTKSNYTYWPADIIETANAIGFAASIPFSEGLRNYFNEIV